MNIQIGDKLQVGTTRDNTKQYSITITNIYIKNSQVLISYNWQDLRNNCIGSERASLTEMEEMISNQKM